MKNSLLLNEQKWQRTRRWTNTAGKLDLFHTKFNLNFSFTASTARKSVPTMRAKNSSSSDSGDQSDHESTETSRQSERKSSKTIVAMRRPSIMAASLKSQHYGSFYLRMGAVGNYFSFLSLFQFHKCNRKSFLSAPKFTFHLTKPQNFVFLFFRLAWAILVKNVFCCVSFQFQMLQITHVYKPLNDDYDASKYRTLRLIIFRRRTFSNKHDQKLSLKCYWTWT